MADFSVPNYGDLINNLNTQIAAGPPKVDFSEIGKLPNSYWEGLAQKSTQDQRDVFKDGVPKDAKGNLDLGKAYENLLRVGGSAAAKEGLGGLLQIRNQDLQQQENGNIFNGAAPSTTPTNPQVSASRPAPQAPIAQSVAPGSPVPSTPRVIGDEEGVRIGIYDPPTVPGARPPIQSDAQPKQVAQYNPGEAPSSVAPSSDPTLGGLLPPAWVSNPEGFVQTLRKYAADASSRGNNELAKQRQDHADAVEKALGQYREGRIKDQALTPEQKNANASGVKGGPLALDTLKEVQKQDADAFQKQYTGIQTAGQNAITGLQKAQMLKSATLDPNFYSGPLSDYVKTYRQFQSVFGSDPGKAAPAELFNKVANDMLQEQIKSMGQSGVGRVLQAEVGIMKQSLASLGITPLSNRALAEIVSRTYQHSQGLAEATLDIQREPGKMTPALNKAAQEYLKAHPLFTQDELRHPQILGAPDAPPQSAQWSPQQKQQWARSIGLKSGDPIRFNGQVVSVP